MPTPKVQSPLQMPAIGPVERNQPTKVQIEQDKQSTLSREWDQRKAAPVGLQSTEAGQGFLNAIDQNASSAIEGARALEGKLGANLSDPNYQRAQGAIADALNNQGINLSDSQAKQLLYDIAQKMDPQQGRSLPASALQDAHRAKDQLEAAQAIHAVSQASHPEHAGYHKQMQDTNSSYNAHAEMINMGIRMAEAAEAEVGRYAQKIGVRLDTIQRLNELDSLMEKYKHLETLDLAKPETGQERDFARMEVLRHELVEERGVPLSWTEGKWATKGEFEAIKKGIDLSRQALFSENQTAQIYLQKVSTSSQQYFLLVTTFITKYGELLKEAIRNMQR